MRNKNKLVEYGEDAVNLIFSDGYALRKMSHKNVLNMCCLGASSVCVTDYIRILWNKTEEGKLSRKTVILLKFYHFDSKQIIMWLSLR